MKLSLTPIHQTIQYNRQANITNPIVTTTTNSNEICSKNCALALKAQFLPFQGKKIPQEGKIPSSIIKKCTTGEKGKIINKKTKEEVEVSGEIKKLNKPGYSSLTLYSGDEKIGYAKYVKIDKNDKYFKDLKDYIGKDGAIYIDYMQNTQRDKYSHIGTLLHRLVHEISKQKGCKGKVVLIALDEAAPFHLDSGFKPTLAYNPKSKFDKMQNKKIVLLMATKNHKGNIDMYLAEENMKKLESGKHVLPKKYKNMSKEDVIKETEKMEDKWVESLKKNPKKSNLYFD